MQSVTFLKSGKILESEVHLAPQVPMRNCGLAAFS